MRLLVDENLQEPTLAFLRDLGHDVRGIKEEGLRGAADPEIFGRATQTERVLLTYNVDFVDLRKLAGERHHGIIRLRVSNQRISFMHPILRAALERVAGLDLTDTLVTVSDKRVRIRKTRTA